MDRIDTDALNPSHETDAEKLHRGSRIALGLVPVVGGALVEVFSSVVESPLTKRRWETMEQIGDVINELLEKKVVTEEGLQQNESFVSTVAEACAISLRNHQKEKLDALKNAVRNSALPSCPPDDYRQMFLSFVDSCTVTHIKLLHLFHNPKSWIASQGRQFPEGWYMGGITQVIEYALPELKGQEPLYGSIWKDLYQRGLISTDSLGTTMSVEGMTANRTTDLGARLIEFLS
jgi:hypothetical protein